MWRYIVVVVHRCWCVAVMVMVAIGEVVNDGGGGKTTFVVC
jgi:hypothetical protein